MNGINLTLTPIFSLRSEYSATANDTADYHRGKCTCYVDVSHWIGPSDVE